MPHAIKLRIRDIAFQSNARSKRIAATDQSMTSTIRLRPAFARLGICTLLAVLALIALRGDYPELQQIKTTFLDGGGGDFWAYYTAAVVVRSHQSVSLYEETDKRNVDPVEDYAAPGSVFAQTAEALGMSPVPMYDYPPMLADLLAPLAFVQPRTALDIWGILNMAAVFASGILLSRLLGYDTVTADTTIVLCLLLFRPTLNNFQHAQPSAILLFLLLCGVYLYMKNRILTAALMFSLAAAIKLTPLIVVIPLLAWRDWKALRSFLFWGASILAFLLAVNGPQALDRYFLHLLPQMARSFTDPENRGVVNALQVLWQGTAMTPIISSFVWIGRTFSVALVCTALWLCRNVRPSTALPLSTARALFAFFLLAACISPVSWLHGFLLGAPALAFGCLRIWERRASFIETAFVSLLAVSLSTYTFLRLEMLTPFFGVALCMMELQGLASFEDSRRDALTA